MSSFPIQPEGSALGKLITYANMLPSKPWQPWIDAFKGGSSSSAPSPAAPPAPNTPTPQWTFQQNPLDQAPPMPVFGAGGSGGGASGAGNPWLVNPPTMPWMTNAASSLQMSPPTQSWGMEYGADPEKLWEQWAQMGHMYGTP